MSLQHFKEQEIAEVEEKLWQEFEMLTNSNQYALWGREKMKEFINKTISSHDLRLEQAIREEERERLRNSLQKSRKDTPSEADDSLYPVYIDGWNEAIDDILLTLK